MSALEIVLISVFGGLLLLGGAGLVIYISYRNMRKKFSGYFNVYSCSADPCGKVFLGDSLTDFFPLTEFIREPNMYNRGIAGDTTQDVMDRLDDVVALVPSEVFLQIGVNDLIKYRKRKMPAETLARRIVSIAQRFSCKVYILSLYPVNRRKIPMLSGIVCQKAHNKRINEVNERLKELCLAEGFEYLDIHSALSDSEGSLKKEYTLEGLHLSPLGYEAVSRKLKSDVPTLSERGWELDSCQKSIKDNVSK